MEKLEKLTHTFSRLLFYIAGIAIMLMMLITTADVILRQFRKPIIGAYDIVCFLSAISISFAIAYTTIQKGHISVNLLTRLLPDVYQKIITIITNLICLFFLYFIAKQLWVYAQRLAESGEVSLTLQLPFYYFVYAMSFSFYSVCAVEIVDTLKNINGIIKK